MLMSWNINFKSTVAIIKKTRDNKCWWGCGKRGSWCTVGGAANRCSLVENCMEAPQKMKSGTAVWSSSSTSGDITKEGLLISGRDICTAEVTAVPATLTEI